ncbi:HD domain-containing protein [Richelia sinica FACHB-800]|nr:HD domain-containing protein [Richelia sinica FACHB-800]
MSQSLKSDVHGSSESVTLTQLMAEKCLSTDEFELSEQVLLSFAIAIEHRDSNTGGHCERLVNLGKMFGEYLELSHPEIKTLIRGAYLHDIGKLAIPDQVLLKSEPLTGEDWQIMKRHVVIGEQICQPLRTMKEVLPIIRHHHERWDGSGYPDGLQGGQIPFLTQVFQMVDIYDALKSERPYKKALSTDIALRIMQKEAEAGWRNPQLIEKFVEFIYSRENVQVAV